MEDQKNQATKERNALLFGVPTTPIQGRFQVISPFRTNDNPYETDLLECMAELEQHDTQVMFLELKRRLNYINNVTTYPRLEQLKDNQSSVYKMWSRRINKIKSKNLIKRITKPVERSYGLTELGKDNYLYLVNPYLVRCKEYREALHMWNQLK